jgi:hypothetical protein
MYDGCEWGVIRCTADGGNTWTTQFEGAVGHCLYGVDFLDSSHGWAVGGGGTILRYNPTLRAPDERGALPPSSYRLSCYPNPFNPTSDIQYDLPTASHISLRIFDLLGREVAVLKDGFVEAGSHRVTFDGSNFSSGIYFARLEAGEFTHTKKLMLLK